MWPRGTATNLGLLAAKGVPRLLAALVARDDTQETSAIMDNPGEGPLHRATATLKLRCSEAVRASEAPRDAEFDRAVCDRRLPAWAHQMR